MGFNWRMNWKWLLIEIIVIICLINIYWYHKTLLISDIPTVSFKGNTNYLIKGFEENLVKSLDWESYLEINRLNRGIQTNHDSEDLNITLNSRMRVMILPIPSYQNWINAMSKLTLHVKNLKLNMKNKSKRSLSIYNVRLCHRKDITAVCKNNFAIFSSAVSRYPKSEGSFFLFNVEGGEDNMLNNMLSQVDGSSRIAIVNWQATMGPLVTHFETLKKINDILLISDSFGSIFFSDTDARGPLSHRDDGLWLQQFRDILFEQDDIAIVGSTIGCDGSTLGGKLGYHLYYRILLHL